MVNGKRINVANPQHALQDMLANETGRIHQQAQSMTGSPNVEVLSICWADQNLAFSSTVMNTDRVVGILDTVRERLAPSGVDHAGLWRLTMGSFCCRWIGRVDTIQRFYRLLRLTWTHGVVGEGGYSAKLTFAASPHLFAFEKEGTAWCAIFLGLRVHYCRSYVGIFAR